ncbi:MAG: YfiR family protein [Candidatus Manganitrophus sp.]|nr:MAG: YfiR family protein [Candidatus Manganitrophus sp.]
MKRRMKRRSLLQRISIFILLIAISVAFPPFEATSQTATEYQVKAAFLYNFAKFVDWPAEALTNDPAFVIGILGNDPFGRLIDEAVAGKTVRDKPILVKRFSRIEEAAGAHILFISDSEAGNASRIVKQLSRAPVLTVSDSDQFAERGGMVELEMEQNRVRFAINVAAVERAGLKPSSQLLKLARIVPEGGGLSESPFDIGVSDRPSPVAGIVRFNFRSGFRLTNSDLRITSLVPAMPD